MRGGGGVVTPRLLALCFFPMVISIWELYSALYLPWSD